MNCFSLSPRALARVARGLGLLIGLGFGLATGPVQALTTLDRAAAVLSVDGAPARPAEIKLPLHWDAVHGGSTGSARLTFEVRAATIGVDHALLLPRVGNSFRIRFNGELVAQRGSAGDAYDDFSKRPRLVRIPAALVAADNRLEIEIDAQSVRKAGLSPLLFGTAAEVLPIYTSQYGWRVTGSLVVVLISLILGSLALLLWIRQRDVLYLIYASAELLWGLAIGDTLIERSFLPWPWWGVITYTAQAVAGMLICKFALIVVERNRGALRTAINLVLALCAPLLALALIGGWPALELLVLLPSQLVGLGVAVVVVRVGLASAELEKRVLAFGMLALGVVLVRDAFVLVVRPYMNLSGTWANHYGEIAWTRFAWVIFGITLAWLIAERLRRSTHQALAMNRTLAQRLAEQRAQLAAVYEQGVDAKRHQARLEERQRLTRDLHDGLGSQLLGALALAGNQGVSRDTLSRHLRDVLDHLKLTVDAMQDTEGDIASLLGALRYRLAPRLKAAGIDLTWAVEHLPAIEGWTLDGSRDLQMILFEAFSNLMAHAGATQASLRAWYAADTHSVCIVLADNGSGFKHDPDVASGGRGLANMRARAARLGSALAISPTPTGTVIELSVPLSRPPIVPTTHL